MLGRTRLDAPDGTTLVDCLSPSHKCTIATVSQDKSANSSPSSDRVKAIRESPSWRPAEPSFLYRSGHSGTTFVHRAGHEADDVFSSPAQATSAPSEGNSFLCTTMSSILTTSGIQNSVDSSKDQTAEPISNDNAQALLPPSACVFVAK